MQPSCYIRYIDNVPPVIELIGYLDGHCHDFVISNENLSDIILKINNN